MRKDVECTFGIMKGRWRVLKSGIRLYRLRDADNIWKTCCALHNWLLEVDGLDEKWEDGHVSSWQGELGEHEGNNRIPQAIRRLLTPAQARNYDTSGMGMGSDCVTTDAADNQQDEDEDNNTVETDLEGRILVGSMSLRAFRKRLITHFDIVFKKREIKWPKRNGRIRVTV